MTSRAQSRRPVWGLQPEEAAAGTIFVALLDIVMIARISVTPMAERFGRSGLYGLHAI